MSSYTWTEAERPTGFDVWADDDHGECMFLGNYPTLEQAQTNAERFLANPFETPIERVVIQDTGARVWTWAKEGR